MNIGQVDFDAVQKVLSALSCPKIGDGLHRAEIAMGDGRRVTGYYVTGKQIRIDIVESVK